ncbi:hypothetical protein BDV96DRAFT_599974 [Lophiotrema nucula]|uniref:Uncharacterized protein n=1 Tax=Lophiotrema nucula TaxID=690887 RepID=A0A6A5Z6Z1_9PLEO|nr:hypothetical protein BDV96DRAFT_599974 [Lophiotrema nucula]
MTNVYWVGLLLVRLWGKCGLEVRRRGEAIGHGKRAIFEPFVDTTFGVTRHYNAATHEILDQKYGDMLNSHNATMLSVTWLESLPTANHTGRPFENLNMTNGRLVTLQDNGVIRAAVGHTTMTGQILESFNEFRRTKGTTNPLKLHKRDLTVNWLSFNTYGENMKEGSTYFEDLSIIAENAGHNYGADDPTTYDEEFTQSWTGNY